MKVFPGHENGHKDTNVDMGCIYEPYNTIAPQHSKSSRPEQSLK